MYGLIATASSLAGIAIGYLGYGYLWVALLALGYFIPTLGARYNQLARLTQRGSYRAVTISVVWVYVASLIGMLISYGLGYALQWAVTSLF